MSTLQNKHLVAVYGSLLKGLHNHDAYLGKAKYIGSFDSEPIFKLYEVSSYPALKQGGHTSVKMEVYEVSTLELHRIDGLEGFKPGETKYNHYNRINMDTPYGEAFGYIYNHSVKNLKQVLSGNWKDYFKTRNIAYV